MRWRMGWFGIKLASFLEKEIIAKKVIPNGSLDFIMRYCKLANDGSIIAVYADPENPNEQFILKKFEIKEIEAPTKG